MRRFILMVLMIVCLLPCALSATSIKGRQNYRAIIPGETTTVSGLMTENTTWTFEGSPYIIAGDIIVDLGVFLTIEPGVTVKFTNDTSLVIDGHLTAQGNTTHKIVFTSNSTTPVRGDWGGINIREYSSPTNLQHVKIEYASTALIVAVECNITESSFQYNNGNAISLQDAGNVYLMNVQVTNNTETGISGSGQNVTIENTETSENGAGINIGGAYISIRNVIIERNTGSGLGFREYSNAEIYDVDISANGGTGISSPFGGRLDIFNSSLTHNGGSGGLLVDLGSVTAEDTVFFNNTNGLSTGPYSSLTLRHCNIFGNRNYGIDQSERSGISVHNSSIQGNTRDGIHSGGLLRLYNTNISKNENGITCYGGGYIYNSFIQNNSGSGVWSQSMIDSVSMDGSVVRHNQYGIQASEEEFRISRSRIIDNVVGIQAASLNALSSTIADNSLANVETQSLAMAYCAVSNSSAGITTRSGSIHQSNIYNHTGYNIENTGGNDINATHNWWGTTNETSIEKKIHDFYDNLTLGRIFYKPYLTTPIEIDKKPPSIENVSWIPEMPNSEEEVAVSATITDNKAVDTALLSYNLLITWHNVSMNRSNGIFNGIIPAQRYNTEVQFKICANDSQGNWVESDIYSYMVVDITVPTLYVVSPENKTYAKEHIPLIIAPFLEHIDWVGYSLDGHSNVTSRGNETFYGLTDGGHRIIIYANDTTGNMGASDTVFFTVDTTPPNITEVSQHPEDNVQPEDPVKVNATIIDSVSVVERVTLNYTYTNSSGSWIGFVEMTNLEANIWNATIPALPADTSVTYIIMAEDAVGNTITTEELGYELEYPVIPELAFELVLSIFMIVTLAVAILLKNHS